MAINLAQLSNVTNAAQALSSLILVTPQTTVGYQPQNAPSYAKDTSKPPPALLFNYEGEQSVALTSDITDHYIEDNTAIQDMIALKPETYTVQGFVGELNDVAPFGLQTAKVIAEKLTTVSGYVPQLSTTAALAYANAFQAYQTGASLLKSAVGAWSSINNLVNGDSTEGGQGVINGASQVTVSPNGTVSGLGADQRTQTKQQIYFQQLYGYWKNRTLFTIQTPWAIFQDMAIVSLRAVQDADTKMISDFEITFKLLRFANTQTVLNTAQLNSSNFQGRGSASAASTTDLGTSTLQVAPEGLGDFVSGVA